MKKSGFTLVELLGVIVVIAIIGGLVVISVNSIIQNGKKGLYKNYKSSLEGAARNYFIDHINDLPSSDGDSSVKILYQDLVDGHYLDELKDPNGGSCSDSFVKVVRKEDNGVNFDLEYKTCLICKHKNKYSVYDGDSCDAITTTIYHYQSTDSTISLSCSPSNSVKDFIVRGRSYGVTSPVTINTQYICNETNKDRSQIISASCTSLSGNVSTFTRTYKCISQNVPTYGEYSTPSCYYSQMNSTSTARWLCTYSYSACPENNKHYYCKVSRVTGYKKEYKWTLIN